MAKCGPRVRPIFISFKNPCRLRHRTHSQNRVTVIQKWRAGITFIGEMTTWTDPFKIPQDTAYLSKADLLCYFVTQEFNARILATVLVGRLKNQICCKGRSLSNKPSRYCNSYCALNFIHCLCLHTLFNTFYFNYEHWKCSRLSREGSLHLDWSRPLSHFSSLLLCALSATCIGILKEG